MAPRWTKESALDELRALADLTTPLAQQRRGSEEHTRWALRALACLEEVFGLRSRYYLTFADFPWGRRGDLVVGGPGDPGASLDPMGAIERKHQEAYQQQLESARGVLLAAADHLDQADLETVYEGKDTATESSAIVRVINLAEHKLRKVMRDRPEHEKDVQNAFESLLVGADLAYSRESESIEYSAKTYTPDFTMPRIGLAIEIKLCTRAEREKEIIAEINDDILAYQTKYGNLVFIVYDLGLIRDTERFSSSFEENENVVVRVVKH